MNSSTSPDSKPMPPALFETDVFGTTSTGHAVERFTLRNAHGFMVRIINYGATVTEIHAPDRDGEFKDVVLGFDDLHSYETINPYFGSTVGRVAFRIPDARFELEGSTYALTANNGPHHIHGGTQGFSWVVWDAKPIRLDENPAVKFTYTSPDGDQGYPGQVEAMVIYSLTDLDELRIEFSATSDRTTPLDMTHHGYFNLSGAGNGDILSHRLQVDAERYSETDECVLATGRLPLVAETPFDFTQSKHIGHNMENLPADEGGFDLAYLLRGNGDHVRRVAQLVDPASGRVMDVLSDSRALIFYTGNYLDGTLTGKGGIRYLRNFGLTLETASLPDALHHDTFPNILLRPGETYRQTCIYRFSNDQKQDPASSEMIIPNQQD